MKAETPSEGGIYVHFAYCRKRCIYCDFALATPKTVPSKDYTDALLKELAFRGPTLGGPARTLYIGGGTPSLWDLDDLSRFVTAVEAAPGIVAGAERTIEANPAEVTAEWLEGILKLGFNRVSLGVQSLDPAELAFLTRDHGREGAFRALRLLHEAHQNGALASYSVDLIYGLPGQTEAHFLNQLEELISHFSPPHLSLYALTIERKTVLGHRIARGLLSPPDDHLQGDILFALDTSLQPHGYLHYEVSSWARPGHLAVHNSAYWEGRPCLNLGAGAHGYIDGARLQNERIPKRYLQRMADGHDAITSREHPPPAIRDFDLLMTGLRRLDIGTRPAERFAPLIEDAITRGELERCPPDRVRLTPTGLRYMDDLLLRLLP